MKVAIAGGTGFVGRHLVQYYVNQKATVYVLTRKKQRSDHALVRYVTWSELEKSVSLLEGIDAIINLAGESINQRWTHEAKERILQSRLDAVERVSRIIEQLEKKPVLVNASGISIYGYSEEKTFTEESDLDVCDFLSDVVDKWEAAAEIIEDTRVVLLRVGIVLGKDGGAFPKMLTPFKLGVGGKVGSGKQIMSWIHVDDLCSLIDFCIANEEIEGPVNGTAPQPVTNEYFSRSLAKLMKRPALFSVPAFVMRLMFGEMSVIVLKGQKVIPDVAIKKRFEYKYPIIEMALAQLLGGDPWQDSYRLLKTD